MMQGCATRSARTSTRPPKCGSTPPPRRCRCRTVIPGRVEDSNPESRDSPMCNCTSEVWSFGPSRNDKRQHCLVTFLSAVISSIAQCYWMPFRRYRVTSVQVSGTEGYADEAEDLFKRYESIPVVDAHRAVLHLIPAASSRVLDIGSGTGRDAAWFASMGHRVVAVEPTDAMRLPAMALHPSPQIEWLNDSLPELALVRRRGER